jgi:pimeloyl-ACP methyl ester carboxylesterase
MSELRERTVSANGLTIACREIGAGPLVVCTHGFPDTAHTWDDLLPRLAGAGFHAVAPNLRGYPPTSAAPDGDYSMLALGRDLLALIAALGEERAFLVGHDWGAIASYMATNLEPARVIKLVTSAIPHARALGPSWETLRGLRHFFAFQLPGAARRLARDDFALVAELCRRWSPNWQFTDEDLAAVKRCFASDGGADAAIAYYRQFLGGGLSARQREARRVLRATTTVPTLCFAGESDPALSVETFDRAARAFSGGYRVERVPGAGHFLHREAPDHFAKTLIAYLKE